MDCDLINSIFSTLYKSRLEYTLSPKRTDACFWVISSRQQPRWIVPAQSRAAFDVLRHWRPYSKAARLKWLILLAAYQCGFLGYLPSVQTVAFVKLPKLDLHPANDSSLMPVIYVGTPGVCRKAVISLVDEASRIVASVVKCPIAPEAANSIRREAELLERLASDGYSVAPRLNYIDETQGVAAQEAIAGPLSGRELKACHVNFLLSLRTGEKICLAEQCKVLQQTELPDPLQTEWTNWPQIQSIWQQLAVDTTPLPAVIQHGDFAPWNLKRTASGLCAIDWEDGQWQGLPLQDLLHFFVIQAYLFQSPDVIHDFFHNRLVKRYCSELSLNAEKTVKLTQFYLIHRASQLLDEENSAHAFYLFGLLCQTDWGQP
jgi:hypothetical protein